MTLNWKMKMSDYLECVVGEDWIDYYSVDDYFYLLEYIED